MDASTVLLLALLMMAGAALYTSVGHAAARRDDAPVRLTRDSAAMLLPRLVPIGVGGGLAAGFFGIGGGFLIVPGLILATAMPLPFTIGTSLVVVSALGLTTATSYSLSGLVDWGVTGLLVAGGVVGTIGGIALGNVLGTRKAMLERGFAAMVIAIGAYITASSI